MTEKLETATDWYIPYIAELLQGPVVDEMHVNVGSVFKVQLNFKNKDNDRLIIYVLPLKPMSEFKFTLTKWFEDRMRSQPADAAVKRNIIKLPETSFDCVSPINWVHCREISVKHLINEIKAHFPDFGVDCRSCNRINTVALHLELNFCYSTGLKYCPMNGTISILNDYEQLLISAKFTDALIKSVDGTEFKVHKSILAVRSEVLNAAFQHQTVESATNVINSPFDNETVQNLLLFLYSLKTPGIDKSAEKLLVAADYYQIEDLKKYCEEILVEQLSSDNVVERLELALTHSCKILEEGALNFINGTSLSDIIKSPGWLGNENLGVSKRICEHFVVIFNKT